MIRQKLTVGLIASAFTLSLSPAWAGQRDRPAGAETAGSAVPRDSGGGGSSSSAPSGGSSDGSTSSNGGSNWMGSSPSSQPQAAPRSERVAEQHRSGGRRQRSAQWERWRRRPRGTARFRRDQWQHEFECRFERRQPAGGRKQPGGFRHGQAA